MDTEISATFAEKLMLRLVQNLLCLLGFQYQSSHMPHQSQGLVYRMVHVLFIVVI